MTEAQALTLVGFLLDRITEDETTARDAGYFDDRWETSQSDPLRVRAATAYWTVATAGSEEKSAHIARHDPERVLAECEAKRRIIEQAEHASGDRETVISQFCAYKEEIDAARATDPGGLILRLLALPYSGHPLYREEWKP